MANRILRRLLFGLLVAQLLAAAETLPRLNIWSGREQVLHFQARESWVLLAEHGRQLSGQPRAGKISLTLPPLVIGSTETARLLVDGQEVARVTIWSAQILAGLAAVLTGANGAVATALQQNGLLPDQREQTKNSISIVSSTEQATPPGLSLLFADRRDFPMQIAPIWTDFSFHRAKNPGCLSVLYNEKEQLIDCQGDLSHIVLSEKKPGQDGKIHRRLVVFTPDFAFQDIENIILLKTIIKEHGL